MIYDDSLFECLVNNQCLDGGLLELVGCLATLCVPKQDSQLDKCLSRKKSEDLLVASQFDLSNSTFPELGLLLEHSELVDCLSETRAQISLTYDRGGDGRRITAGWNEPLTVDGHEVRVA